jgi:hypothetical protein
MRLSVQWAALLPGMLLCALSWPWRAAALQLENLQGVPTTFFATKQLPVCASSGNPAIVTEMPKRLGTSRAERWWEHTMDDDTRCNEVSYARPARALGTKPVSSELECAASCRCRGCQMNCCYRLALLCRSASS